ncbi:hypothetical protein I317_02100 [Kwoniella heveanensis CBS 569]|nr:hypothetical protein I317_02100 [Kwoniella heveanensis CBS 569]
MPLADSLRRRLSLSRSGSRSRSYKPLPIPIDQASYPQASSSSFNDNNISESLTYTTDQKIEEAYAINRHPSFPSPTTAVTTPIHHLPDPTGDHPDPNPSNTQTRTIVRRKSILKLPMPGVDASMNITWDEPRPGSSAQAQSYSGPNTPTSLYSTSNPTTSRKLQKASKGKNVRFTPSTTGDSGSYAYTEAVPSTGLLTPDGTPEKSTHMHKEQGKKVKKKSSWVHWPFRVTNPDEEPLPSFVPNTSSSPMSTATGALPLPTLSGGPPSPAGSDVSWHHHPSFFPEYEPIYPTPPRSHTASLYPLSQAEIQAQEHSARVGHSVVVHYPMLPSWAEYEKGNQGKAGNGWQSGRNGMMGWNGFGWDEDKAPKAGEMTFGKPAPVGQAVKEDGTPAQKGGGGGGGGGGGAGGGGVGGKKKKKKGGGGGGGGEDEAAGGEGKTEEGDAAEES